MMKMMLKLSPIPVLFLAIVFHVHVVSARTRAKPFFFDYEDIFDDLREPQPDKTSIQELQDESVQTIDNQRTLSNGVEVECKPRPIPVKIPAPNLHATMVPRYVILNQCLGPGYTSVEKCTATKRERVSVHYRTISANGQADSQVADSQAVMYNHLECGRACIAKPEDCNSKTETFEDCICKCRLNDTYCESLNRYYDRPSCQCECKVQTECQLYMEWNPSTCQCECSQCIKQMCEKHDLALDESMCKCNENKRVTS